MKIRSATAGTFLHAAYDVCGHVSGRKGKEPEAERILQSQLGQHGPDSYTNAETTMVYRRCPDPNKRVVVSLERMKLKEETT